MVDWQLEALRVIDEGLPDLPPHPIRKRWIPVARWRRDPWAAVWLINRRKKSDFQELVPVSYRGPDGWADPMGGGGRGCPFFVDPQTRQWQRATDIPAIRRTRYLIPPGMSYSSYFFREGLAPSPLRVWTFASVPQVDAVRIEIDSGETYVETVASPLGAIIVGISDESSSAKLVPLDDEGRELAGGWLRL